MDPIQRWLGSGSINIFGLPFAGKDTHAQALATALDAVMLSGGDILRNSVIPEQTRLIMERGELVPTEDYVNIVLPYLSKPEFAGKPLLLSSVGRWYGEEAGVVEAAQASGHELKAVIYLKIDAETAFQRWEQAQIQADRGERADDDQHKLDTRFGEFAIKTLPVIEYYRQRGLLIEIDGRPSVGQVSQDILAALAEFAEKVAA